MWRIGNRNEFDAEIGRPRQIFAVATQDEFCTRIDCRFDFAAVETVNRLGLLYGPGIFFFCLIASLFMRNYPLSRARHEEIVHQLESRRSSASIIGSTHNLGDEMGTELGAY